MLVDPAGGTPVVLRLQVAQHAAALAVHERSGRLLATRAETALSNVKQKCPIWIKCRLTTFERGARVGTIRKTTNGHHQLSVGIDAPRGVEKKGNENLDEEQNHYTLTITNE